MADYNVNEILQNIFNSDSSNLKPSDSIPLFNKEIEQLKSDLRQFISSSEYDIEAILQESRQLCVEGKVLEDEMDSCKLEIENETMAEIVKSIENHELIGKELQSVNYAMKILGDVVQCGNYVKEFVDERGTQSYTRAIESVFDLMQFIEIPADGFKCLDMYANTLNTAEMILERLLHELLSEWDRMVVWSANSTHRRTIITITLNMDDSYAIVDVLKALNKSRKLEEKVSVFAQFLLKDVLTTIIYGDCTVFAETSELMTITVMHRQNFKPPYDAVVANLRLLFHYLSNKFNIDFGQDYTIMTMIGNEICVDFREILVRECLVDTIPNNINDLQSYGKITSEIADFQHFLTIVKFFPEEGFSILEYVNNIDVLFASKSSQYFLEAARNIMLKDLSVTMSIGVESIPDNGASTSATTDCEAALAILKKTIPKSLFYFPRCMISKTAQELLDLVYMMMEQAVQCSDVVCKKLYNTTRLVFELYDAVVPYHHENYLLNIPQYVALFHNNCMYLAHNLQTFGDKWLILMEGRDLDYPISFVDLVQKLRELGYKHLTIHMQQQRKQILDSIRSSDLNCLSVKDELSNNAEAAVRQCLRQLQLLKNVWIGVFPINVFTRLMSTLVNMLVEELIHRVCSSEDICAEMAVQVSEIYARVVQKAPQFLQTPEDIETHVKSWPKFKELIYVLSGSLKDIEKHWADGTGPLALLFQAEELRTLIKALFQNTQIRANLLSKIK